MLKVTELIVYPVKSFKGIKVDQMLIDENGPVWDRKFMMVNEDGVFRSMRDTPEFALIQSKIESEKLFLSSKNHNDIQVDTPKKDDNKKITVSVFGDKAQAYLCSEEVNNWVESVTQKKLRMVSFTLMSQGFVPKTMDHLK